MDKTLREMLKIKAELDEKIAFIEENAIGADSKTIREIKESR